VLAVARLVADRAGVVGADDHHVVGLPIARVLLALGRLQLILEALVVDAQVVVVARGGNNAEARLRFDAEQLAVGNTDHVGGLLK
jgi:hypothetical protein